MCGIAGIVDLKRRSQIHPEQLKKMAFSLKHRGPDEEGYFLEQKENLGLLNTRLSIIDLDSGSQPMVSSDQRIAVVQNGEIYNFKSLKEELEKKALSFSSNSDTEVILKNYAEYGEEGFSRLDGMFAIAIYDESKESLILCRDRIGKKPLYYYQDENWFLFGSEIRAIFASGLKLNKDIHPEVLQDYFLFGVTTGEKSIFKKISKVPPGFFLRLNLRDGSVEKKAYWKLPQKKLNQNFTESDLLASFSEKFEKAVSKRMVADVEVGAFLSGGMDSSAVVLAASKLGFPLKTYTVAFSDAHFDESSYASQVAKALGLENKTIQMDHQIRPEEVRKVMSQFDEPFYDESAIPTYYLTRLVSSELKVALSGDGGDESLLGYRHYENYRAYPRKITDHLPSLGKDLLNIGKSFFWEKIFLKRYARVGEKEMRALFPGHSQFGTGHWDKIAEEVRSTDFLDFVSKLDLKQYLVDDVLVKVDRMSMQNSLEVRCPLLDPALIEFLVQLSPSQRRGEKDQPKYLLRRYLEEGFQNNPKMREVFSRRKHGFSFPASQFVPAFSSSLKEWLLDPSFLSFTSLDLRGVEKIVDSHLQKRKEYNPRAIWLFLCLFWWWEENAQSL